MTTEMTTAAAAIPGPDQCEAAWTPGGGLDDAELFARYGAGWRAYRPALPAEARERLLTFDDALAAALALEEISAGHEDAAEAILAAARLGDLSNSELEALCRLLGTAP